jgi:hypothetical protein
MVNQDYKEQMVLKGRTYNLVPSSFLSLEDRFIFSRGNRIPFIACFTKLGSLQIGESKYVFRRRMDSDSVLEIFQSGSQVVHISIRFHSYYVGKGILLDEKLNVLAMLTVSEEFYNRFVSFNELNEEDLRHFTLVFNHSFETDPSHRTLYSKFRKCYKSAKMSRHFSRDPEFESFARIVIPAFTTLPERQEFIAATTDRVFEGLLT